MTTETNFAVKALPKAYVPVRIARPSPPLHTRELAPDQASAHSVPMLLPLLPPATTQIIKLSLAPSPGLPFGIAVSRTVLRASGPSAFHSRPLKRDVGSAATDFAFLQCDIGFENRLALENTRLLLTYA